MQTPNTQGLLRQAKPAWLLPTRTPRIKAGSSRLWASILSARRGTLTADDAAAAAAATDDDLVVAMAVIVGFSIVAVGIFSRWFRCMSFDWTAASPPVVVAPLAVSGVVVRVAPWISSSPSRGDCPDGREQRRPMSRLIWGDSAIVCVSIRCTLIIRHVVREIWLWLVRPLPLLLLEMEYCFHLGVLLLVVVVYPLKCFISSHCLPHRLFAGPAVLECNLRRLRIAFASCSSQPAIFRHPYLWFVPSIWYFLFFFICVLCLLFYCCLFSELFASDCCTCGRSHCCCCCHFNLQSGKIVERAYNEKSWIFWDNICRNNC